MFPFLTCGQACPLIVRRGLRAISQQTKSNTTKAATTGDGSPSISWPLIQKMIKEQDKLRQASWERQLQEWKQENQTLWERQLQERREYEEKLDAERAKLMKGMLEKQELQAEVMKHHDHILRLSNNFNIRGALERVAYQAAAVEKIIKNQGGVQDRLNVLAASSAFQTILTQEAAARKLIPKDIKKCIDSLYHEVSKHAHGNTGQIEVNHTEFAMNEAAAIVCFLKLQAQWSNKILWTEVLPTVQKA